MSAPQRLARILASREGEGFELAIETEGGSVLKVIATEEQVDILMDELDDLLLSARGGAKPPA